MSPLVPVFARQYRAIQGNTRQYAPRGKLVFELSFPCLGPSAMMTRAGKGAHVDATL